MVSGFVTSPEDQSRICLLEASPMRMASKSLMSIKFCLFLSSARVLQLLACSPRPSGRGPARVPLFLQLEVDEVCFGGDRAELGFGLLLGHLGRWDGHVL